MSTFIDPEFGVITIRRSAMSRSISIRVAPDGTLRANMPPSAGLGLLRRMIDASRTDIAKLMSHQNTHAPLRPGMTIGKSHTLIISTGDDFAAKVSKSRIGVTLTPDMSLDEPRTVAELTPYIIKALRQEAKAYLPRRLDFLAIKHGFTYESVRFSHASSRWGSCSSRGTISLNIALMKLPFELIDYVLFHELSHLRHMNHSPGFWSLVESLDPYYREHRRTLKTQNPSAYV